MRVGIITIVSIIIMILLVEISEERRKESEKQYTLDSLHYAKQEAQQDSIINKLDLIYGDVRRAE